MNICEKAHRQKSIELEKIDMEVSDGWLSLKLLAYPIKKQVYTGRLAFVVYYEYQTLNGYYTNFDDRSGFLPRFWINKDKGQKTNDLIKGDDLILKSHSYQEIRAKIVQMAIFDSVNQKALKSSMDNIKWFNEHRDEFSKRRIGSTDFARDKKRLEPGQTTFSKLIENMPAVEETPYEEVPATENVIEINQVKEVEMAVNNIQPSIQNKPLNLKISISSLKDKKSSGMRKFLKNRAA